MPSLDYEKARTDLETEFGALERQALEGMSPAAEAATEPHLVRVFESKTKAYREVLLGCVLVRMQNLAIDIHKPYVSQGADAYNGRTLDERVVNPFLQEKRIPCSRGAFLSTFRRSVAFGPATRDGLRDKEGFDALLTLIDHVAGENDADRLVQFLRYLLFRLLEVRAQSVIPLARLQHVSLEQYDQLLKGLLDTPSGGRFPVILVEVTFLTLKEHFRLDWEVESHGINVADRPVGAPADIVVRSQGSILLAAEVTERTVDKDRVVATFQTKIAPQGIEDYLFFTKTPGVQNGALEQTRQYFAQGHEVNFLEISDWMRMLLATMGKSGRAVFNRGLVRRLEAADIPPALKIAWNQQIAKLTAT